MTIFQVIKDRQQIDFGSTLLIATEINCRNSLESEDQIAQRFEILVATQYVMAARQILVNDADGPTHVAYLVGNRSDRDTRSGKASGEGCSPRDWVLFDESKIMAARRTPDFVA